MTPRELFDIVKPVVGKLHGPSKRLKFSAEWPRTDGEAWADVHTDIFLPVEYVAAAFVADLLEALCSDPSVYYVRADCGRLPDRDAVFLVFGVGPNQMWGVRSTRLGSMVAAWQYLQHCQGKVPE